MHNRRASAIRWTAFGPRANIGPRLPPVPPYTRTLHTTDHEMPMTLDPSTPKDQALSALQTAGAEAPRLIQLWLEHANVLALSEISTRGSGDSRRAARKALRVLQSRGITVPRHKRVVTLSAKETQTTKAWLLAPDPAYNILIVLARRSGTSRFQTALVYLNDDYGVTQVQHGEYAQSALKKTLEGLVPGGRYKPVEVGVEWARWRIFAALEGQRQRGLVEPLGLTSVSHLLGPPLTQEVGHPFDAEGLEVALEDAREMSKDSGSLHNLAEFAAWLPSRRAIDAMLLEVGKNLKPGEQPDPEQLQQLLQGAVVSATDRYFTPEQRERLVRAMKDSALSILAREGESTSLRVAAAMQCIKNAGLITDPPSEIPFLKAFFDKAVAYLLAEGKGSLRIPIPAAPTDGAPPEAEASGGDESTDARGEAEATHTDAGASDT